MKPLYTEKRFKEQDIINDVLICAVEISSTTHMR